QLLDVLLRVPDHAGLMVIVFDRLSAIVYSVYFRGSAAGSLEAQAAGAGEQVENTVAFKTPAHGERIKKPFAGAVGGRARAFLRHDNGATTSLAGIDSGNGI